MNGITGEMLARFRKTEQGRPELRTLQAALARTEMKDLAWVPGAAAKMNGAFTIELKTRGVTWQKKSGRCWMFAAMNILRERAAEKCGLEKLELSGNYLAFYDKLEKANNALELAIAHAEDPMDSRWMEYILDGFHDGGYWDMAADLIRKYGVVPLEAMPETWQSTHTERFTRLLLSLIRKDICLLRKAAAEGKDLQEMKEGMLEEVYRMECAAFGEPPASFDFSWKDQNGAFHEEKGITGQEFCRKYAGGPPEDYATVTNHPTRGLGMDLHYVFHYIGSMADSDVDNLNLTAEEMEELALAQLSDGEPVWFGCDSDACGHREEGIWDPDSVDYSGLMGGVDFRMEKGERLMHRDSYATHAMILTGVHLDESGKPDRWKIENSWGEEAGRKGYFVCSEKYFREYVYEVIVRRKYLNDRQKAALEREPLRILPWESDCR